MARLTNLLQMVAAKSTAHEYLSFPLLLRLRDEGSSSQSTLILEAIQAG